MRVSCAVPKATALPSGTKVETASGKPVNLEAGISEDPIAYWLLKVL
jgi:hypothetical protein